MASIVKKLFSFALLLSLALASLSAQEPQGYYQSAEGLKQKPCCKNFAILSDRTPN